MDPMLSKMLFLPGFILILMLAESLKQLKMLQSQLSDDINKKNTSNEALFLLHLAPEFCIYDNTCNLREYEVPR